MIKKKTKHLCTGLRSTTAISALLLKSAFNEPFHFDIYTQAMPLMTVGMRFCLQGLLSVNIYTIDLGLEMHSGY